MSRTVAVQLSPAKAVTMSDGVSDIFQLEPRNLVHISDRSFPSPNDEHYSLFPTFDTMTAQLDFFYVFPDRLFE